MGREGLFQIAYATSGDAGDQKEKIIIVARDGKLFGADRFGGIYRGALAEAGSGDACRLPVSLTCDVPPAGELVTGFTADGGGAAIEIQTEIDLARASQKADARIGGARVEIEITYLGPLPR